MDQTDIPFPVSGLEFCENSATTCEGITMKLRSDIGYANQVFGGKEVDFVFERDQCEEFIEG